MSALPPKADMVQHGCDVRFVPKADSCTSAKRSLFDHLVGEGEQRGRYGEAERLRSLEINHQVEFRRLFDWEIRWFSAF
jgi:hypothetical protein